MGTQRRSGRTFWPVWAAWLHGGAGEAKGEMTPGGTPKQAAKRLIAGAPLDGCNRLCDEVIRAHLETLDISTALDKVGPGDSVCLDGSHHSFMNSGATIFFLEMPRLPPGALVHIHDTYLSDDYPRPWRHRYHTERHLPASGLLGRSAGYEVHCPNHFISRFSELAELVPVTGADPRIAAGEPTSPTSFWLRESEDRTQ